jgi:glycerol-3-phosphate dehydrogenase
MKARTIVNATGCWAAAIPHSQVTLRLTKGIHLVVDHERFPVPEAVVMADGRRILFAIPWGSRVILGTTDTDYDGSLEDVRTDATDVSYVLNVVNQNFPQARLTTGDVISDWAGVRPLISTGSVRKGTPSDTSRNHQIKMPEPGWIDVAGGKLTTYRLMAQQTVDLIGRHLKRSLALCRTAEEPLIGPAEAECASGIIPPALSRAAVEQFCMKEWAREADDVMLRRTSWRQYHRRQQSDEIARQVGAWMAEILQF